MVDAPNIRPVVFISYARADSSDFVDRLEQDLLKHSLHPWVDRRRLESGEEWMDLLQDAVDQCQAVVVVLSPAAVESKYVKREYRYADANGKLIIPVLYLPTPRIPMDLYSRQWADFLTSYEDGLRQLLHSLSRFQAMDDPSHPMSGLSQHGQDLGEHVIEAVLDPLDTPAETPAQHEAARFPLSSLPTTPPQDRQGWSRDRVPQLLQELITSTPGLVFIWGTKKYIEFVPQEWDRPDLSGAKGRILYFQFENLDESLKLQLVIGPGPLEAERQPFCLEIRQHLLTIAGANQPPFKPAHDHLSTYWNSIFTHAFLSRKSDGGKSEIEVQEAMRIHWKNFLERELPALKVVLRDEPRIWK